ncbi:FHA domain-containing protein, partial [Tepidimonas sp.]|uniref:FHA domain-containing protein n=1 Tax=Tepidimonas sp. TaxID=2002775 RepID=UPI002FDF6423
QIARYELQVLPGEAGQVAVASPAATPPPTPAPAQAAPLRAAADEPAPVVRVGPPATSGRGGSESAPPPDAAPLPRAAAVSVATLVVVDGPSAGRAMPLHKPLTTVGRPGVTVAAVLRTAEGHAVRQSDGTEPVLLNGVPIGDQAQPLHAGDVLTVAGTRIRYVTDA